MTFEEQFPSLKGRMSSSWDIPNDAVKFVYIETIAENCLDRQKVREAIVKLTHKSLGNIEWINPEELFKELNL